MAIGDVVSIELPDTVQLRGEPALGNSAIFDVKVLANPRRILVWPKLPKGAENVGPEALLGERSNLQIFLDGDVALLIELRVARPDVSVQRVRFRFPEREKESAYVRERVAEERRRLEAELLERRTALEAEIGASTRERFAKGMLAHAECAALRDRGMRDLVVLRATRICRVGADVFVAFSVQNRSRSAFSLERVEVRPGSEESQPVDAIVTFEGGTFLVFDQSVRGVIAWSIDPELDRDASWTLSVVERAGRMREVSIDGVGF